MVESCNKNRNSKDKNDIYFKYSFLEKRYGDAICFFKFTLTLITIIFLIAGILMAYVSISGKKEIN